MLGTTALELGRQPFSFRNFETNGAPVTEFDIEQEKKLHLIVVRHDLTGFQHLHPKLAPDGTWSTGISFAEPGEYRVFADFVPAGGEQTVLGADVRVGGGTFSPKPLPEPAARVRVDGYEIRFDATEIEAIGEGELKLDIMRNGSPVKDLQPYLGALGHAVILREDDLAYLHAHPLTASASESRGTLRFHVMLPAASRYRAFVQFRHDGAIHTAAFTIDHASHAG